MGGGATRPHTYYLDNDSVPTPLHTTGEVHPQQAAGGDRAREVPGGEV